jgi:hypothetical protein
MLIKILKNIKPKYLAFIAEINKNNLEKKPANGGIPHIEKIFKIIINENNLFRLNKLDKSVRYLTGLLFIFKDKYEVHKFIFIIIYINIYNNI